MRNIRINRLRLENFKCHQMLELNFNGEDQSIYGDNATGKTSVYDGLLWLLFGKDSAGNGEKNMDLKPLDENGDVRDHEAITSVEAVLTADGEEITLKRTLREIWSTRRGCSEMVYDGNTSDFFVNGVPCKKNAYDKAVGELVDENLFRMLTNVSHFASGMKWQERRSVLFDIAGSMSDEAIMAKDERFSDLADSKGKLSVQEFKTKLLHQKKGLSGTREDGPARISECQRTLSELEDVDFEAARDEEALLTGRRDRLSGDIIAIEQDAALQKIRLEKRAVELQVEDLDRRNRIHREQQRSSQPDTAAIMARVSREAQGADRLRDSIARNRRNEERLEKEIQESRELWVTVNGEAFAGGKCPACGQALPFEALEKASREFEEKKQQRLQKITNQAQRLKEDLEHTRSRTAEMEKDLAERESGVKQLQESLEKARQGQKLISDLPEYDTERNALREKIRDMEGQIDRLTADSGQVIRRKRQELSEVTDKLNEVWRTLAKEGYRQITEKRIEALKEDMKNAAEAIEAIDKMLFAIEEFVRFKCKFVEESVNGYFRLCNFRLFREQANGGIEERCDAQQGGVPYMSLNNGMKVNVGIDIINTLSRHYGVTVPLFVDNAEAVTKLESCQAQVIRLVVSENDKELRMV